MPYWLEKVICGSSPKKKRENQFWIEEHAWGLFEILGHHGTSIRLSAMPRPIDFGVPDVCVVSCFNVMNMYQQVEWL
jgi:hypothetical protein